MELLYPLSSMSFAYPWALLFPFLLLFFYRLRASTQPAVEYPDLTTLQSIPPSLKQRLRLPVLGSIISLCVVLLSLAAARPQRISAIDAAHDARNLMLCLDVSRSMSARDFESARGYLTRLSGVKQVITEFIKQRELDRLGVVVFGSASLLLAPLTTDHNLLTDMVERIQLGIAGDGTAIGDGLGLSLKRLREIEGESKAIILITDGVNNSGQVNPLKAAQVAKDLGIKIHTIGIGGEKPVTIPIPGSIFSQNSLRRVEFDEATLRKIAEITGGVYFNASNLEGLTRVYQEIDQLEKTSQDQEGSLRVNELFVQYLIPAILLYLAYLTLSRTYFRQIP